MKEGHHSAALQKRVLWKFTLEKFTLARNIAVVLPKWKAHDEILVVLAKAFQDAVFRAQFCLCSDIFPHENLCFYFAFEDLGTN